MSLGWSFAVDWILQTCARLVGGEVGMGMSLKFHVMVGGGFEIRMVLKTRNSGVQVGRCLVNLLFCKSFMLWIFYTIWGLCFCPYIWSCAAGCALKMESMMEAPQLQLCFDAFDGDTLSNVRWDRWTCMAWCLGLAIHTWRWLGLRRYFSIILKILFVFHLHNGLSLLTFWMEISMIAGRGVVARP